VYISNGTFTFDISNQPTLSGFEKVIGEKTTLVAKCVPNTEEYFPRKYNENGKLSKVNREYFNPDDENYDGKKVDYIEKDSAWINEDNEWLYCLVYDGYIVKIGMTINFFERSLCVIFLWHWSCDEKRFLRYHELYHLRV
jgi:hypothetical protein